MLQNCVMNSLIPHLIVAGLGASVSPVAVTVLLGVMMGKHTKRNSLLYLLGYTLLLVVMGTLAVFIFNAGGSGTQGSFDSWLDLGLGVLCFAIIPMSFRKKKEKPPREGGLQPWGAFALGVVVMLTNMSTIVIYLSGAHSITRADLSTPDSIIGLLVLTALTLVTILVPIAIYLIFPKKADRVLRSMSEWLKKHSRVIGIGILLVFGIYLVTKSIVALA